MEEKLLKAGRFILLSLFIITILVTYWCLGE